MVRSVKKGPWLINYIVHNSKVIELLSSFKDFKTRGWDYRKKIAK